MGQLNPHSLCGRGLLRNRRAGFTVVELLVVVVIILIVLTIATPAFRSLIYSSERSSAFNSVEASVAAARDIALRTGGSQDGAVVFLFDPGGPVRIVPAVKVGVLREPANGADAGGPNGGIGLSSNGAVERDVFVPVLEVAPVNLPSFWHVRGYAAAGSMIDFVPQLRPDENAAIWYNSALYGGPDADFDGKLESNWVFPESGFYGRDVQSVQAAQGTPRQSFMIRFDAKTGSISRDMSAALLVDVRPSFIDRPGEARMRPADRWLRPDRADDLERWAAGILQATDVNRDGRGYQVNDEILRRETIGILSNDSVLVKPVSRLAVYDARRMARDLGARGLNSTTQSLYAPVDADEAGVEIVIDDRIFDGSIPGDLRERINAWINGDTNFDSEIDDEDAPEARIYVVQPGTGELAEVLR